jgi:hypothetical protein
MWSTKLSCFGAVLMVALSILVSAEPSKERKKICTAISTSAGASNDMASRFQPLSKSPSSQHSRILSNFIFPWPWPSQNCSTQVPNRQQKPQDNWGPACRAMRREARDLAAAASWWQTASWGQAADGEVEGFRLATPEAGSCGARWLPAL